MFSLLGLSSYNWNKLHKVKAETPYDHMLLGFPVPVEENHRHRGKPRNVCSHGKTQMTNIQTNKGMDEDSSSTRAVVAWRLWRPILILLHTDQPAVEWNMTFDVKRDSGIIR